MDKQDKHESAPIEGTLRLRKTGQNGADPSHDRRRKPIRPGGVGAKPIKKAPPVVRSASESAGVRLSKIMAERGICSRREADQLIERGWVFVDGVRITALGTRIQPEAQITLAPEAHQRQEARVTILLHKPVGYVSGQPEPGYVPAVTLIGPGKSHRRV